MIISSFHTCQIRMEIYVFADRRVEFRFFATKFQKLPSITIYENVEDFSNKQ